MTKRRKHILLITIIFLPVIIMVMLLFCHKHYSSTDYVSVSQELRLNEPFTYEQYPNVQLTVLEIDKGGNKCLFELRDLEGEEVLTRWVNVGGQIWGNRGTTLQAIDEKDSHGCVQMGRCKVLLAIWIEKSSSINIKQL